jgi:hypothetical protein
MKNVFLLALLSLSLFTADCAVAPSNLEPLDGSSNGIELFKDSGGD